MLGHAAFAQVASASSPLPSHDPIRARVGSATSPVELHATIKKLVGFGTRHTLSDKKPDRRESALRGAG